MTEGHSRAEPGTPRYPGEAVPGPGSPQRGRLPPAAICLPLRCSPPPAPLSHAPCPPISPAPALAPVRRAAGSPVRAAASRGPRRRAWRFQDGGGAGAGAVRRERVAAAARASSPLRGPPPRSRRDAEIHRLLPRHRLPLPHRRGAGRGPALPPALLPLPAPPGGGGGAVRSLRRPWRGGRARPRLRYSPGPARPAVPPSPVSPSPGCGCPRPPALGPAVPPGSSASSPWRGQAHALPPPHACPGLRGLNLPLTPLNPTLSQGSVIPPPPQTHPELEAPPGVCQHHPGGAGGSPSPLNSCV